MFKSRAATFGVLEAFASVAKSFENVMGPRPLHHVSKTPTDKEIEDSTELPHRCVI